jgi:hypothetical protein
VVKKGTSEAMEKKVVSKAPALPPRRKHVAASAEKKEKVVEEPVVEEKKETKVVEEPVVEEKKETKVVEEPVVEEKENTKEEDTKEEKAVEEPVVADDVVKKEELKRAAAEALAATAAAAAAHDARETIANVEKLSDIVDDQIKMANEEAIEAVVEIVEAEAVAEKAVEEADKVLEESKKEIEKEIEKESKPFAAINGPPKKKKKKKSGEMGGSEDQDVEPVVIENVFTVDDLRGKTLSGKTTTEDKSQPMLPEESNDQVEALEKAEHPSLSFANAPGDNDEVTPKEKEIRDMIVEAHKLANAAMQSVGDPQSAQMLMRRAIQTAQDAMDLCVEQSQTNGNIRPSLVAATAFALADVKTHAYGGRPPPNELKVAFAVALEAIENSGEDSRKGGKSKAYIQFGGLMQQQQKPKSALASYLAAYDAAKADYGDVHQMVEQAKYDYTAYLAKCGRSRDCVNFLLAAAKELQEKADVLEAEAEKNGQKKEQDEKKEEAADADGEQQTKTLPIYNLARHFAMKNLMNAAGVLDTRGDHVESQEVLADTLELAIGVHGENSLQHMNALYAIGTHCKVREAIDEAIACHEAVLNIMDATIQVYDPDLLQNRVAILKDTALLYDLQGHPELAIDYAEGACINAQTLARIYAQANENFPLASRIGMMEPFWQLLIDLKTKVGDTEGAAAARRELNKGRLNLSGVGQAQRGGARPRRAAPATRSAGRARR